MKSLSNLLFCLLSVGMLLPSQVANATLISASSNGYGLSVSTSAIGLNLNAGPLPTGASGSAPAPYNLTDSVANVNVTGNIPVVVSGQISASAVNGTAVSNVNGLAGSRTTSASGGVVGANIGDNTLPVIGNGVTLLGINGTLNSTAQITGDFGSLAASGTTTIQSLGLTVNGIPVNLAAFVGVSVAPNTSINLATLGIANASLILNEQVIGSGQSSIIVNAFHLTTNIANVITANVILGHSQVTEATVPEPATIAMAGVAFAPMLMVVRSSRRRYR